ncbi:MAG: hypothetical protein R3242_05820 [Akkermansiaceae bacterium]|nr:hypothetical protein [Akkermansiaceae bacterium]
MSTHEFIALATVIGVLLTALPLVRLAALRLGASVELARKGVHVCMGLACMGFPWIFHEPYTVWLLALSASGLLIILRSVPALRDGIGSALHGVQRVSYGEILFAPAIATVFQLSGGDPVYYLIPIAVLTIADAAGALTGARWGRLRYICGEDYKTVEGSLAFLACAFLCVFLPLQWLTDLPTFHLVAISLILAILTMIGEGISDRGFDNLVLPIGAYFILERLLPLDAGPLIMRLIALTILSGLVLWGCRWSTLNGSSLLGGALLLYGCAILGDWRFALPLLALYLCHMCTTRRHQLVGTLSHPIRAVIGVTLACLPWLIANAGEYLPTPTALAGLSFAMATQLAIFDMSTWVYLTKGKPSIFRSIPKGWLIAGAPGLVWLVIPNGLQLLAPMALSLIVGAIAVKAMHRIQGDAPRHEHWLTKGSFALISSTPALLLMP